MHMSDALVSLPVAAVTAAAAVAVCAVAINRVRKSAGDNNLALMGVMGAFVFAAQMINFAIPGTGSSGHIVGGVLLAAVLGPWAAFLTLVAVVVLQCLVFADGGLMALGCNILNMAALTCLVAYPLVFRPLIRSGASYGRIMWVSTLTCTVGLMLGAAAVTLETVLSGITVLPFGKFFLFMMPIHFAIGICEGLATGAVLCALRRFKPSLLISERATSSARPKTGIAIVVIGFASLVIAGGLSLAASSLPDGLEWSIERTAGATEIAYTSVPVIDKIIGRTAVMPDYNTTFAGIVGSGAIILLSVALAALVRPRRKV